MKKFLLIAVIILIILVSGILVFKSGKQLTLDPRSQLASVSGSGSGLVAHYTFDDGTAKDVAGGNNGTVTGATAVAGRIGGALSFNGTSGRVTIPASTSLSLTNKTIGFWVKPTVLKYYSAIYEDSSNQYAGINQPGEIRVNWKNSTGVAKAWNIPAKMTAGEWQYMTIVYALEGENLTITIYRNGIQTGSANATDGLSAFPIISIGARNSGSTVLDGVLDDVRIYNRALSVSEVSELYSETSQGSPSEPQMSAGTSGEVLNPPPVESACVTICYVRADATGGGTGNDWTNAFTKLPGTLARGATYYIADGNYDSYTFDDPVSGTGRITIKKATSNDHGANTGWQSSFGDGQASFTYPVIVNTSYVTLDGQIGSGTNLSSYGFRVAAPANCSQPSRMLQIPALGAAPVTNVTLKYWAVRNCGSQYDFAQSSIYMNPNSGMNQNITLENNFLGNSQNSMIIRALENSQIKYNHMTDGWSSATNHGEAISPGNIQNTTFAFNTFINPPDQWWGTGVIAWHTGTTSNNNYVYGNIVKGGKTSNGIFTNGDSATANVINNSKFFNNTFVNVTGYNTGLTFWTSSGNESYNNLWVNSENITLEGTHDYNSCFGCTGKTFTETNGQVETGNPLINLAGGDFHLTKSTKPGKILSSPFTLDKDGKSRGSDGTWDRGAYEFSGTYTQPPADTTQVSTGSVTRIRGGQATSFSRIQDAVATAQPGDEIRVGDGVYRESVTMKSSGVRLVAAGSNVVIDGADPLTGWTKCASQSACGNNPNWQNIYTTSIPSGSLAFSTSLYEEGSFLWWAQSPNQSDPFLYDETSSYRRIPNAQMTRTTIKDSSYLTQNDPDYYREAYVAIWRIPNVVEIKKIKSFDPSTDTITFDDMGGDPYRDRDEYYSIMNNIEAIDRPGEYAVDEAGAKAYLWPRSSVSNISISKRLFGIDIMGKSNIVIDGFKFKHFYAGLRDFNSGVAVRNGNGGSASPVSGIIIRDNEISQLRSMVGQGAITIYNSGGVVVENNHIHDNQKNGGMLFSGSNVTAIKNRLERNTGTAIRFYDVNGGKIISNRVSGSLGTHANGLTVYGVNGGSENVIVYGNIVTNTSRPLTYEKTKDLYVLNNIFDGGNINTYVIAEWGGMSGTVLLANNIAVNSSNHASLLIGKSANYILKNNVLDGVLGAVSPVNHSNNIYVGTSWQQDSKWQMGAGDIIEKDASKIFVNSSVGDHRLKSGSLAIDKGTDLNPLSLPTHVLEYLGKDAIGAPRPQGLAWDIGAHEYGNTTNSLSSPADTTPPSITLTKPLSGQTWTTGRLAINAYATDNTGVVGVTFYINGEQLGTEKTIAPYAINWKATVGTYTITAKARDAKGNTAISQPVIVTIIQKTRR